MEELKWYFNNPGSTPLVLIGTPIQVFPSSLITWPYKCLWFYKWISYKLIWVWRSGVYIWQHLAICYMWPWLLVTSSRLAFRDTLKNSIDLDIGNWVQTIVHFQSYFNSLAKSLYLPAWLCPYRQSQLHKSMVSIVWFGGTQMACAQPWL